MTTECLGTPSPSSPSPTKPTTPNNRTSPLSQRPQNDVCFNCHNKGHWASDCPFKTPPQSHPPKPCRSSSSSSYDTSSFAPILCPKCHGSISVRISRTKENPGRHFYTCSEPDCKFFKWCNQVAVVESEGGGGGSSSKAEYDKSQDCNPECACGAGKCKVVLESKRKFFVCPIQKGHGACSFRRGYDDILPTNTAMTDLTDGGQVSHRSPKRTSAVMSDLTEGGQGSYLSPKRTKFESPVTDNPDPLSTPVGHGPHIEEIDTANNDNDDIWDMSTIEEMVREEAELANFGMEKSLLVSRLSSEGVHRRQAEFMRQISASEDATVADRTRQVECTLITGWLGRLAFPPSGGLVVPQAKPFFCCVFPSLDPISVPKDTDAFNSGNISFQPHTPLNTELDSSLQILSRDSQSGILLELASIQNVPGIRQGRDYTGQISKALFELGSHVQNQLLSILESTEPCNHKSMTEAANKTFSILNSLSVDHRSFTERVRKFISCASSLAEIEESLVAEQSSEKIMEWYDNERANFDKIKSVHAETLDAMTTSEKRLKSLGEEASLLKEMLLQIEDQLRHCEKESAELKIISGAVSKDMLESEKKLQEAKAAKKLHEEREKERNAAKESLEGARIQLQQSVIMM